MDKIEKRELMRTQKIATLEKNVKLLKEYAECYTKNVMLPCNIFNDEIILLHCTTKQLKRQWTAFTHFTTSLPYQNSVGRQVKLFVLCGKTIIGMLHITSAMAQLKLRDEFIGWDFNEKWTEKGINQIYNIQTCVPILYNQLLSGKLLVYCAFSENVKLLLEQLYNNKVKGFEVTSLYGKSSLYNRIPFLNYLGNTEGNSAVLIDDKTWKALLIEYYEYFPKTKTNRQAPVKFQIIDKLKNKYDSMNKHFPYQYQSVNFERGVYYGEDFSSTITERVSEWRERWLKPRAKRIGFMQ